MKASYKYYVDGFKGAMTRLVSMLDASQFMKEASVMHVHQVAISEMCKKVISQLEVINNALANVNDCKRVINSKPLREWTFKDIENFCYSSDERHECAGCPLFDVGGCSDILNNLDKVYSYAKAND